MSFRLNIRTRARRGLAGLTAAVVALLTAVTVLASGAGTANADTPGGRVSHVWLNVSTSPSTSLASQYLGFIQSLRGAAGHYWVDGIYATQTESNALIRADFNFNGEELRLWFTPNDLYLRGFTNESNQTFFFDDPDYDMNEVMENLSRVSPDSSLLPPLNHIYRMQGMGSNYNSMVNFGGLGREDLDLSFDSLWNTLYQLQYSGGGTPSTARSLLFMIQFTSEAARFWDVAGVMSAISQGTVYQGLPIVQQEIENDWDQMSRFAENLYGGVNGSHYVGPHAGTISTAGQLRSRLAMSLGNTAQANPTGDWWHTEI